MRLLGFLFSVTTGLSLWSCSSPEQSARELTASRELAGTAVHAALDNGAFEAMLNQAVVSSFAVAKARIEGSGRHLTAAENQQLEEILRRVFGEVYPRAAWEAAFLPLFLDNLDRKELEEVVAFQRSPLGRKLTAIQAQLATGGAAIGERLVRSRQEEFTRRLAEELTAAWKPPPPQ